MIDPLRRIVFGLSFLFLTISCGLSQDQSHTEALVQASVTPTISAEVQATPSPLCPRSSRYTVTKTDLNQLILPCNMYFYIDIPSTSGQEKYFRVVAKQGTPIHVTDDFPDPTDQLTPYWYKWIVFNNDGQLERSWLAYFLKNRDGTYHTIVRQSEQDWYNSKLEVYFEDINGDGVREDVIYEIMVGDFIDS